MTSKMIVSGNATYGLGKSLSAKFPQAQFCSRTSGYDFLQESDRFRFAEESLSASVYISCSALDKFAQTLLLQTVVQTWEAKKHSGQIIVLGSSADTPVKGTSWIYPTEKKALRAYSRSLSQKVLGGHGSASNGIRVTYLSPGHLDTPEANKKHPEVLKLDCDYVTDVVAWLLSQPANINISELCLDPIQTKGAE